MMNTNFFYSEKYLNFLEELLGVTIQKLSIELPGISFNYAIKEGLNGPVFNALPFFGGFGGPIFKGEKELLKINLALEKIIYDQQPLSFLFIENPSHPVDEGFFPRFKVCDSRIFQYTNLLDVTKGLFERIEPSTRRNIKKATRNGIIIRSDDSDPTMNMIWHLENMHSKKVKTKPDNFFSMIEKHFHYNDDYLIYYAYFKNEKVASLLLFYYENTVEYFIPSYNPKYLNLEPMSLLIYTAMQDAQKRNMRYWNWGGISEKAISVYKYKKKWDTQEIKYRYFLYTDPQREKRISEEVICSYPYFYVYPVNKLKELHENEKG